MLSAAARLEALMRADTPFCTSAPNAESMAAFTGNSKNGGRFSSIVYAVWNAAETLSCKFVPALISRGTVSSPSKTGCMYFTRMMSFAVLHSKSGLNTMASK